MTSLTTAEPARPRAPAVAALSLVPPVTGFLFWTTKILTTGAGEVTSDYLGGSAHAALWVSLAGLVLLAALLTQFRLRAYNPTVYWLTALMVSVFGTSVADIVHVSLGVSYVESTTALAALLAGLLIAWRQSEGTLSIHSVTNHRRQVFYWSTVMCSFALGTAAGDLFASTLHLGYLTPALLFTALIAVPLTAAKLGANGIAAFWTGYILTRPLGASFADWAAVRPAHGGLGLGSGPVALLLLGGITVALVVTEIRRRTRPTTGLPDPERIPHTS